MFLVDISGGLYEAMGGEHSHAVAGVFNAGSYIVVQACAFD